MKRIALLIIVSLLLWNLSGCTGIIESIIKQTVNVKPLSLEQSKKNFTNYETQLKAVLDSHGLTVSEEQTDESEFGFYRYLTIQLDDTSSITVRLSSTASQGETGREDFFVDYDNSGNQPFDMKLFVEIVNTVSGKEISESYCDAFLSAPEEEQSSSNDEPDSSGYKKIHKIEYLNFGMDWLIEYTLYTDETEELFFAGLTKQLEE